MCCVLLLPEREICALARAQRVLGTDWVDRHELLASVHVH